jgi:hypothetical protein
LRINQYAPARPSFAGGFLRLSSMWMIRKLTHGSSFRAIFKGKDTGNRGAGLSGSFGQWMKCPRQADTLF